MNEDVYRIISTYDPALAYSILYAKGYGNAEIEDFYLEYHDSFNNYDLDKKEETPLT